ncbi:MAG: Ig-like domain-containing protein [Clostridia bacterium]|nr:Ig-like domain-containing protein [Clostridia bacterium]
MQKKIQKVLSVIMVAVMFLSASPITQITGNEVVSSIAVVAEAASKKIQLKKKKIKLTVGETYSQKLLDKNGKTIDGSKVTWKSKNKKIAKVSKSGKVTAVKAGKTTITAKYNGKTYKFTVTVKNATFKYSKKTLIVGSSFTQKLRDADGDTIKSSKISWWSSDKSIAKVNKKGKVTAVSEGTVKITGKYKGKKYRFNVTVIKPSIILDKTSLTMIEGDMSVLYETVVPSGTEVLWSSSNSSVATVDAYGVVKAVRAGKATITATAEVNGKNYTANCYVTVNKKPPTPAENILALKNYISKNGKVGEYDKYIQTTETINRNKYTSKIIYRDDGKLEFSAELLMYGTELPQWIYFVFDENTSSVTVRASLWHESNDWICASASGNAEMDVATFAAETDLLFELELGFVNPVLEEMGYDPTPLAGEMGNDIANLLLDTGFASWNLMMLEALNMSISDIGFESYTFV